MYPWEAVGGQDTYQTPPLGCAGPRGEDPAARWTSQGGLHVSIRDVRGLLPVRIVDDSVAFSLLPNIAMCEGHLFGFPIESSTISFLCFDATFPRSSTKTTKPWSIQMATGEPTRASTLSPTYSPSHSANTSIQSYHTSRREPTTAERHGTS